MDLRLIMYGVWAVGSMFVWGLVLRDDIRQYRFMRRRGGQERRHISIAGALWSDFALVMVAVASGISILSLVVAQEYPAVRGFTIALALGGFLGAGLVKYTFRRRRR